MTRDPAPSPQTPMSTPPIRSRRAGLAIATVVALAAGLLASLVAPRGPVTTGQVLVIMLLALLTGLAGGLAGRTRWALLPMLVASIVGVELGRLDVDAASLALRFDTPYGIIAFLITRGLHGLLVLLPMSLGLLAGIGLARRLGWLAQQATRRLPIGSVLLALLTLGLAVLVVLPASTPPVLGANGQPVPGSLAELTTVELGGRDHAVMLRAADPDTPVLLYLAGGPGQSDLALSRALTTGWLEDVVFATFDQRGNGKSYPAIDPVSEVTLERAVADVVELSEYLRERFDEERIYLMGESWGTLLGVLAVQARPDLYHAWIGSGQMVDVVETDQGVYRDLVAFAEETGDGDLLASLRAVGEPPYRDIPWANSNLLAWYEHLYKPYTPSEGYRARGEASGLDPFGILGSEYAFIEKANVLRGLIDTFTILYPQLYSLDLRETASRLQVPVYILDGLAELDARRGPMLEWFAGLEAPHKERIPFEAAAHAVAFEQADAVQALLTETIIPATYDGPG